MPATARPQLLGNRIAAQVEAVEMGEPDCRTTRVDYMRDGQQHEGVRIHARRPERSLQISRRVRVTWETANPIDAQMISVLDERREWVAPFDGRSSVLNAIAAG